VKRYPIKEKVIFAMLHPLWRLIDRLVPKQKNYWAFATHHLHSHLFVENQRALFEEVKGDKRIKKIIFYRGAGNSFHFSGANNTIVVRHGSTAGLYWLLRCKVLFITHSVAMEYSFRWGASHFSVLKINMKARTVVNLWHALSVKRLLYTANAPVHEHTERVAYRARERRSYAGLISSSDIDSYAMASMFYPLNYKQVWITGLPRNDFLSMPESTLPDYIKESLATIRSVTKGRPLITYAPTYRQTGISETAHYYQFCKREVDQLMSVLVEYDCVFGYRPHYFKNTRNYFNLQAYVDGDRIVDISQSVVPDISAVSRESKLVITDYSSVSMDMVYLGKPGICFAYDQEHYSLRQDGLLYDLTLIFGDRVYTQFQAVLTELRQIMRKEAPVINKEMLLMARRIFFKHIDDKNAARVVQRVREHVNL